MRQVVAAHTVREFDHPAPRAYRYEMAFDLTRCLEILERTPHTLEVLLLELSPEWTMNNEGPDTWSPYDVIGHLIHGERTDWMARMDIILSDRADKTFATFDRFAQFRESHGKPLATLLAEFHEVRAANLDRVRGLHLTDTELDRSGTHPSFGTVTLRQLLATWTAHDLDHLMQIARVMAKQVKGDVGPWVEYLRVVRD
jgi:DinB superfamily